MCQPKKAKALTIEQEIVSLKLWRRVRVSLEGTVDDICALINEIWHDWLVHGAIPWNVSRLSKSVPVASTMVLMVDWSLPSAPLTVSIWHWWVAWQNTADIPPEEVWVVEESALVEPMVIEHDWSLVSQTSANTTGHEEDHVSVGDPASHVEVLDWQLSNDGETQEASDLSSSRIVGPVVVRRLSWSSNDLTGLLSWEPRSQNVEFFLGLGSPLWEPLINLVGRQTETDQLIVFNVVCNLIVQLSTLSIIESVLNKLQAWIR